MIARLAQRMVMITVLAVVCIASVPALAAASAIPSASAFPQVSRSDPYQRMPSVPLIQTASSEASPGITCAPDMWQTDYFANETMHGSPRHQLCEATKTPKIYKNWQDQAPQFEPADPVFPADAFSVRATCLCDFTAGSYLFSVAADDGAKLLVDGEMLIDTSVSGAATKTLYGAHIIMIEYSEHDGNASLIADWNVDTTAPKPIIASPPSGDRYEPGSTVSFSGSATDDSGAVLPESALAWNVRHIQCPSTTDCQTTPVATAAGSEGSFVMPQADLAITEYIVVSLTATDPKTNQSATATTNVYFGSSVCEPNTWKAQFFPVTDLSGVPTYERCWRFLPKVKLKQDWLTRAPIFRPANAAFPKDFSARFICNCSFSGATHFTLQADSYAVLSIDGIDRLDTRIAGTYDMHLTGMHRIVVAFVDAAGPANLFVQW